ncbi:hypothetical protein E3J84_06210 [Candidatus Aerophobetes bacterium]|uniref:Uncharacterized protein n=1 Tax=Aerophobetes bacterium TaxID=2030807 RepID=A0A523RRV0_UNCAE|nr:MAG: hypothetical protein E3J84_06210 [Candidatus Aerophobetes bacterium]
MSHTMHRLGDRDSLKDDFVVLAIAAHGVNAKGAASKFKNFFDIVTKYEPSNFGDMKQGNKLILEKERIKQNFRDNSIVHGVFNNEGSVVQVLKELKEANLGLSIVVSGIIEKVNEICRKAGLKRHTVEQSLGIWGATEKLPSRETLEIITMCGHGMISSDFVEYLVEMIAEGRMTARKAAEKMGKLCICGIFNIPRAERLLSTFRASQK